MLVITIKGEIEKDLLEVKDIVEDQENCRATATEWYLDGELVRRDVWINPLNGLSIFGEQESLE